MMWHLGQVEVNLVQHCYYLVIFFLSFSFLLLFSKLLAQSCRADFLSKFVVSIFNQLFLFQITSNSLNSLIKN